LTRPLFHSIMQIYKNPKLFEGDRSFIDMRSFILQNRISKKFFFVAALFAAAAFLSPGPVLAHSRLILEDGGGEYYFVTLGFGSEPVFAGHNAGVEVMIGTISQKEAESLKASSVYYFPNASFRPIKGLYKQLGLEISASAEKKVLRFQEPEPPFGSVYRSNFIPTSVGPYFMRLFFVALSGKNFDFTISCKSDEFHNQPPSAKTEELTASTKIIYKSGGIPCPQPKGEGELPRLATVGAEQNKSGAVTSVTWFDTIKSTLNSYQTLIGFSGFVLIVLIGISTIIIIRKRNKIQY